MKRFGLLLLLAIPSAHGDTCLDAVTVMKRAAHELSEDWFSVCKGVARDDSGRKTCAAVHDIYEKVFTQ